MTLPKIITSSVIRGADIGDSHGGVYLIDLETEKVKQVLDWDTPDIDWAGRGGDRGLRGIVIFENRVYMAASDEIFIFDKNFNLINSISHSLLKHCHEIFLSGSLLYITSTGYNAILVLDLEKERFLKGIQFRFSNTATWLNAIGLKLRPKAKLMQLMKAENYSLVSGDSLHINNVHFWQGAIYFSGTRISQLYKYENGKVSIYGNVPKGGHNTQPFGEGLLMNDTARKRLVIMDRKGNIIEEFLMPIYKKNELQKNDLPKRVAQQGFARGLIRLKESSFVVGSSPATISMFERGSKEAIKSIQISNDLRNAIHGLELWTL